MIFQGVFLSTEGVRWEPIDADTATLFVPFGCTEDAFKVYFDPATGLIEKMETMRWKNAGDQEKTRWQGRLKRGVRLKDGRCRSNLLRDGRMRIHRG